MTRRQLAEVLTYAAKIAGDRLEQRHARQVRRYIVKNPASPLAGRAGRNALTVAPRVLPAGTGVTTKSLPK